MNHQRTTTTVHNLVEQFTINVYKVYRRDDDNDEGIIKQIVTIELVY